MAVQGVQGIR